MKKYDVTIIGAGLAGLFLARILSAKGFRVLIVDRKTDLSKGIHTTGIFVRKTFEDFDFPADTLGKPISSVKLYSPTLRKIEMKSETPEFRVGKMALLYERLRQECESNGVDIECGTRYLGSVSSVERSGLFRFGRQKSIDESIVSIEKHGKRKHVSTTVLVGADGAKSRVAKDLGLDENKEWIVGFEEVLEGVPPGGEPVLHCFLDNKLAPGYLAWISNDGEESHMGVGGYPSRFDPKTALRLFKRFKVSQIIDTGNARIVETRGGRIPVGGVLKRIACERGLLIGDAAGAVSPLTAGGLDPCLRLSEFAAEVIETRLHTGDAKELLTYSGAMFRKKFTTRLLMRSVLKLARSQTLLELGFSLLTSRYGLKFAEKIFFRRASFPDVRVKTTKTGRIAA